MLLVPEKPLKPSIDDVSRNIGTFQSKLYTFEAMLPYLYGSNLPILQNAMNINPPETSVWVDLTNNISNQNGIFLHEIDIINDMLSKLPPNECANYDIIDLPEIMPLWVCLTLRNERRDLLKPLNIIIAERMNFINNLLDKPPLSEECMKHIYPPENAETSYVPLSIYSLSGAFAVLVCLLMLAFLCFAIELLSKKTCVLKRKKNDEDVVVVVADENDLLHLIDRLIEEKLYEHIKFELTENVTDKYCAFRDAFILARK
jgi:hypothetical protein